MLRNFISVDPGETSHGKHPRVSINNVALPAWTNRKELLVQVSFVSGYCPAVRLAVRLAVPRLLLLLRNSGALACLRPHVGCLQRSLVPVPWTPDVRKPRAMAMDWPEDPDNRRVTRCPNEKRESIRFPAVSKKTYSHRQCIEKKGRLLRLPSSTPGQREIDQSTHWLGLPIAHAYTCPSFEWGPRFLNVILFFVIFP